MAAPPDKVQRPRDEEEPIPPMKSRWSDVSTLLTDQLQIALDPRLPFGARYEAEMFVGYELLGRLEGLADAQWLANVEKALDDIEPAETTIAPEGNGVLSFQIGRGSGSVQRFNVEGMRFLIQREDEKIYRAAYSKARPLVRELLKASTDHGLIDWKREIPSLNLPPPEKEDDSDAE